MKTPLLLVPLGAATLMVGATFYAVVRPEPPILLPAALHLGTHPTALPAWMSGSLPSFIHTLAFSLISASLARSALLACATWVAVNASLELCQLSCCSAWFGSWLQDVPLGARFAGYFSTGTFSVLDLIATLFGGIAAFLTVRCLGRLDHE